MQIIDYTHLIPNQTKTITDKIGIVYHITTDNNKYQALNWFKNPNANASAHFIIEKDGEIGMCVDPKYKAWHSGIVKKPTANIIKDRRGNPNDYMIGVEVVAKKGEELTPEQIKSLIFLTKKMCKEHNIIPNIYHLIGHNEVNSIDKVFCPVSVYEVSYIISKLNEIPCVKNDIDVKLIEEKAMNYDEVISENELLKRNNIELIEEVERLDRVVRKERERYAELKEMYQDNLQELRDKQN